MQKEKDGLQMIETETIVITSTSALEFYELGTAKK